MADVGAIYHDDTDDIWYECGYDTRRELITWAIVPPNEPPANIP